MCFKFVLVLPIFLLIACKPSRTKEMPVKAPETNQVVSLELKDGDIIFHASKSEQSEAIQIATRSRYSHCGILFMDKGKEYVLEAVGPVKKTPLVEWIARGENGHYVVKRLKDADNVLTVDVLARMKAEGRKMLGKKYDLTFRWSDDRIYCSELVWKIYQRTTGIELATLDSFRDFDLTGELTRAILKDRFGEKIPYDEKAISPGKLFESDRLETVLSIN